MSTKYTDTVKRNTFKTGEKKRKRRRNMTAVGPAIRNAMFRLYYDRARSMTTFLSSKTTLVVVLTQETSMYVRDSV